MNISNCKFCQQPMEVIGQDNIHPGQCRKEWEKIRMIRYRMRGSGPMNTFLSELQQGFDDKGAGYIKYKYKLGPDNFPELHKRLERNENKSQPEIFYIVNDEDYEIFSEGTEEELKEQWFEDLKGGQIPGFMLVNKEKLEENTK